MAAAGECDLPGVGLHFDQVNEISVLEPEVAEQTNQLAEECKEFMAKMEELRKIIQSFKEIMDITAAETESAKMEAIATRGILKSAVKQRKAKQHQLHALILEKRMELERLKVRQSSLKKVIHDSNEFIEQLIASK